MTVDFAVIASSTLSTLIVGGLLSIFKRLGKLEKQIVRIQTKLDIAEN